MPNAASIIKQVDSVLKAVAPPARTARMRVVTRTGGDPLIGKKGMVTYTDSSFSPQPYFSRLGREHVPGGHADSYDYIDGTGRQRLADDYTFIFSPTAVTRDQLEDPNVMVTLTNDDGTIELLSLHDIEPAEIYGAEVLFVAYMRSCGETPGSLITTFTNAVSVRIDYNMGTNSVVPVVTDASGNPLEYGDFIVGNSNTATLTFATPQSGSVAVKSVTLLNGFAMNYSTGAQTSNGEYVVQIPHRLGTTAVVCCAYNGAFKQIIGTGNFTPIDPDTATLTLSVPESGVIVVYPT